MKIANALKEVHAAVATIAGIRCAGNGKSVLGVGVRCANVAGVMTTGITEIGIAEDVKMIVESRSAALWVSGLNACANVVVKTKDLNGGMIDGPTNVATDAITPGALQGSMSFVAGTRTPGVTATATLSFDVTGSVVDGGKFVMILPDAATVGCDSTWTMPAEPTISVTSPDLVLAAGVWTSADQKLEITTARSMITEGARVVMQVHNVRTPSCLHTTGDASVTSYDGADHVVDATTSVAIANMSIGALGGDLTWTAADTTAAMTTTTTAPMQGGIGR